MILNLAEGQGKTKIAYSGAYTTKTITVNGVQYTLYTITGSGTLTVKGKDQSGVGIWLCGGGNSSSNGYGGGGGYFAQNASYTLAKGTYTVTVGAAKGTTTFAKAGTNVLTAAGSTNQNGSSGGGGAPGYRGSQYNGGTGSGTSTRPFGDSTNFTSLPCAGGGGGSQTDESSNANGGAGGSNGAAGSKGTTASVLTSLSSAKGGATGGGNGRISNSTNANATYYGSGSGGRFANYVGSGMKDSIPSGYQGVVFMRVPIKATPAPSGSYSYYRLNMTGMMRDSASGTFFSVAELKLYNGSAAISYTGATFTASSSLTGYPVAQAFDGNASTIWHVDGSPTSAWIQAQLSSAAKVTSFSITARSDQNDRLNAFTLQGSNDGSSWTTLYTGSNTASDWVQGGTKTFTI